jgi:hypothetical protein
MEHGKDTASQTQAQPDSALSSAGSTTGLGGFAEAPHHAETSDLASHSNLQDLH